MDALQTKFARRRATEETGGRRQAHYDKSDCVSQLQNLGQPHNMDSDVIMRRFVEHTLQLAIQASLDIASHVVSDAHLGEAQTNRDLFNLLAQNGWLQKDLAATMAKMAGFRNILVHGYTDVDLAIIADILENRLADLLQFCDQIENR